MNLRTTTAIVGATFSLFLAGCATQTNPVKQVESPQSLAAQAAAQAAVQNAIPAAPALKRKIALGRITNETTYGRSLLRTADGDPLGKQVSDILSKALVSSGHFTVLERTDLASLQKEATLTNNGFKAVGADVLLIGSVSEFGRKTVGESGFWSSTKRQVAYAKMDVRLVDTTTGQVIFSTSGAGEASNESASIAGFGSRASYDGTLNDKAISQAASEVVSKLVTELSDRPWKTYFLSTEQGAVAISGGKSQGLKKGMRLAVLEEGKLVKSQQTGFDIRLPGREIAQIEVISTFGDTPETEGSLVKVVKGSIAKHKADKLVVEEIK